VALLPPPETLTEKITSAVAAGEGADRKTALKPPSLHPIPTPRGRSLVRSIQERLADRGYYSGPIDGSLGSKTRAAIRAYQRVQRDPATGQPSAAMFEELEDYALEASGLDQFRKGAYEAAILTYSRIIQRKSKYADAYFNRGLAYNNSGHREQALADYEKAIQLDPWHNRAYLDRANIRYQQGLYRDAARDYFKVLKLWIGMG
jgi:peptidoglycan hydrolase-like protein with peptidoglycan-binding domain